MITGFVYEIKSKDTSITGTYIGSCWDMKYRKYLHNHFCHNKNWRKYNYPLYRYIRENGGFDTFEMTIINMGECEDITELECAEQFYIDMYGGIENLLNSQDALVLPEEAKKRKDIVSDKNKQKNIDTKRFYCECCDYASQSNCDLNRHYTTNKHKKNILKYI
tara:strand:+ start:133 stop:621 length:489 start_codon:yes stop_codon:yes gene_type:complete